MKTQDFYTAIVAEDFDKTIKFYVDVLGLKQTHMLNRPIGRLAVLENDAGAKLEIMEKSADSANAGTLGQPGIFGLRTNVRDMDATVAELKDAGIKTPEPFESTQGRNLLIKDPNGVSICIIEHSK